MVSFRLLIAADDQATQWIYDDDGFTPCVQLKCKPAVNDSQAPAANDAQNQDDQPNTDLYHIITDHLGTPRELLDDQGNIAWQRRHSTWGNTHLLASPYTKAANDDLNCPLVFQGQYADQESGLHYNRFRYYDPDTAQYCSPDPLGLVGGFYPQAYVHNPNTYIDFFGLYYYYQLQDSTGKTIYHGITDQDIETRMKQHARGSASQNIPAKVFDQVSYVKVDDRIAARNIEGSALYNEWESKNKSLLNSKRKESNPGYYHSYDPDKLKNDRKYLIPSEIEKTMKDATTKTVNKKGKFNCKG